MEVKITEYNNENTTITYEISAIDNKSLEYLYKNLNEEDMEKTGDKLKFKIHYKKELYPFQSQESQLKINDYIAREEIEIKYYIESFLEDMD